MQNEYRTIEDIIKDAKERETQGKKIYIVAAGMVGKNIGELLTQNGIKWYGYIDRNTEYNVGNKKIFDYGFDVNKDDYFIISSVSKKDELISQLRNIGVIDSQIACVVENRLGREIYEVKYNLNSYLKKNKKFYNCYKGKRCFVIGNGPSLTTDDLESLKNEYTFACNSIYAVYDYVSWRPTFYCYFDRIGLRILAEDSNKLEKVMNNCEYAFIPIDSDVFNQESNYSNLYYVWKDVKSDNETSLPLFSNDCSKVVYSSGTVTYGMLQLACYMGFTEIYLLGIDFSYITNNQEILESERDPNHMDLMGTEEKEAMNKLNKIYGKVFYLEIDRQKKGYISCKNYAEKQGISIINATRGGKLEVFPRKSFEELMKN